MPFDQLDSGKYYADCAIKQEKWPNADWEAECTKLWDVSEELVKEYA